MSRGGIKKAPIDDPLVRGRARLWVEDVLTRKLLETCWTSDPVGKQVAVQPAGGRGGVEAMLRAVREEGRRNEFGLVDRDFGALRDGSLTAGPLSTTPGHEIENALLDFPVLATLCARSAEEVAAQARGIAERLIPWMALRRVVREIKLGLPGTPEDPRPAEVASDDAALEWLRQSDYPAKLEKAIHQKWTYLYVQKLLRGELKRTRQTWEKNEWVTDFSGKEIVARLRSPAVGFAWMGGVAASDEALAVAVAQRWRQRRAIPAWITTLRDGIQKASAP